MSDFICYNCDGILMSDKGNKYFTYFTCERCGKHFCLANDRCDTWSWRKKSRLGNSHWADCSNAMHKKNPHIVPVKVVFT